MIRRIIQIDEKNVMDVVRVQRPAMKELSVW